MELLLFAALLGLIPASIARGKGREFVLWWVYGAALFIIALPHALLLKPEASAIEKRLRAEGMKKCPFCAEMIKSEATVCRYCSSVIVTRVNPPTEVASEDRTPPPPRSSGITFACPTCGIPVTPARPICPKCGVRVRLSRPA